MNFLLAHIQDFINDEAAALKQQTENFVVEGGLDKIEKLIEADPGDPNLPARVFERISAFFDSGLMMQKTNARAGWHVTDVFWRGKVFHLDSEEQVTVERLIPQVAPLQVHRANALKTLGQVNLQFLAPSSESDAYLFRPTPSVAYVLISNLAAPWSADHIENAHRLVNKCFIF